MTILHKAVLPISNDNKRNLIYVTFLSFEHIIVWSLYLDSTIWRLFFLNEFNSHCVSKLVKLHVPNVSNIIMMTLKLGSVVSYTLLLFVEI